jgi:hypothetical protein
MRWILAASIGMFGIAGCKGCGKKSTKTDKPPEAANASGNKNGGEPGSRKPPRLPPGDGTPIPTTSMPLPADADAVLEINVSELRKLPIWPAFERRLYAEPFRRFIDLLKKNCGLDPLAQVEHLLGGVRFESSDGLVRVKGTHQMAKKVAKCVPKMARAVKVSELTIRSVTSHGLAGAEFRFAKAPPVRFTELDENRFALAAGAWVDTAAALEKGKSPKLGPKSHIFKVRRTLGRANLAWVVFLGIPPGVKEVLPSMAAVARVRTIGAALHRKTGSLVARVVLDMRQPKSAQGLAGMLTNVLPQLKKLRPAFARFDPFLSKVRIKAKGPLLHAEAELSDQQVKKLYGILTSILKKYIPVPRAKKGKGRKK